MEDKLDFLIGQQLKARRKELGYSLQDVGNFMKTTRTTIMNYENGYTSMNISAIIKLCGFLRLDYISVLENARLEYYGHNKV